MIVSRLFVSVVLTALLASCGSKSEILQTTLQQPHSLLSPECEAPGTSQPIFCNYRLVVKNVKGNIFQGYVDPKLVIAGEKACKEVFEKNRPTDHQGMPLKNFKCQEARFYRYSLYQFEIEGEKPRDDEAVDLVNIPFTNKLRKGQIEIRKGPTDISVGDLPIFQTDLQTKD
ncbi:MAG: hypothetical protein U0236_11115 [Nitrospira sp.]